MSTIGDRYVLGAGRTDHDRPKVIRDTSGGRRAHTWAKDAGFELMHVDAYHPHYLTGEHKGFWNWTLRNVALTLVTEGSLSMTKFEELVDGMTKADESPDTVVAHARMHQVIARKPVR